MYLHSNIVLESKYVPNNGKNFTRGNMAGRDTLITGMWRRRKGTGNESYHYGKTKQALVLPKGEIYLFEVSALATQVLASHRSFGKLRL